MGEQYPKIVYGELVTSLGKAPGPLGWFQWLVAQPWFDGDIYDLKLEGAEFMGPYESEPEWVGFLATALTYGQVWVPSDPPSTELVQAQRAWAALRSLVKNATGMVLPEGRILVIFDE